MLQRLFTNTVELTINNRVVLFNSLDDFEFALDARTAIPLEKINDTVKASKGALQEESDAIDFAKETLSKLVSQSPETSSGITMRLKSTNSAIFSKDNGWRDIIVALNGSESLQLCQYKQIALKMYLRYLSNRLGLIKTVQDKNYDSESMEDNVTSLSSTSSFDIKDQPEAMYDSTDRKMKSIPKGKSVVIRIKKGERIELSLSNYKCELLIEDGIKFIDYNNIEYPVLIGKNKIGRSQGCTVKFDDGPTGISRVHMTIMNHNNKKLEFTDLSNHGTYYQHFTH
ncbi:MAG TPA: FHA domain-containing protein [Thiotrichaceae bacterium]|jgi:hypothetical protein|nr:FHA domain-containing protein [Thiotrichaceae bacterium]HIM08554.1 FHA domain-containing protein [Gammaproteobacteria bacterium]